MSDTGAYVTLAMLLLVMVAVLLLYAFGFGYQTGRYDTRQDALTNNAAHYEMNPDTGAVVFVWGEKP